MLEKAIHLLVSNEVSLIKRRFAGFFLIFCGFILMLLSAAFLSFSLFLWLSQRMPDWQAALFVTGVIFLASLVVLFAGKLITRRPRSINAELEEQIRAIAAILLPEKGKSREKRIWSLVAVAALIGMMVGRSSGK